MILSLVGRLMLLALPLAIGATAITAAASTVGVAVGSAVDVSSVVTPNDLKPVECAGITVTALVAGSGTVDGSSVAELVIGSAAADTLTGGGGDDCLLAGGGADTIEGGQGNDVMMGGAGDDTLQGGPGADVLYGGAGVDVCNGGGGPAVDTFPDGSCETEQ